MSFITTLPDSKISTYKLKYRFFVNLHTLCRIAIKMRKAKGTIVVRYCNHLLEFNYEDLRKSYVSLLSLDTFIFIFFRVPVNFPIFL